MIWEGIPNNRTLDPLGKSGRVLGSWVGPQKVWRSGMGFHYWGTQLWQNVGPVESRPQAYPIRSFPESYKIWVGCYTSTVPVAVSVTALDCL